LHEFHHDPLEVVMTPRTWSYADVEDEHLRLRDRPYEHYGEQGLAMPTYALEGGAAKIDLGEPVPAAPSGPRGYRRSDERIYEEVCMRLTDDEYVDATDLEVVVHHGEVSLIGTVADPDQRARAVAIAEAVRGVVDVLARVRVRSERGAPRSARRP
jgi:hypothetical protein